MINLNQKIKKLNQGIKIHLIKNTLKELGLNLTLAEILDDGTVNYNGPVDLASKKLKYIPIKFGIVTGTFDISRNELNSLMNCPRIVIGNFRCSRNNLTSLEYMPQQIGGDFCCSENFLNNLQYSPKIINGNFYCLNNQLKDLVYCPETIGGNFEAGYNHIDHLRFFPNYVVGYASVRENPVNDISTLNQCFIGGGLYLGETSSPDLYHYNAAELDRKFRNEQINTLKKSLDIDLTHDNNIIKKRVKI